MTIQDRIDEATQKFNQAEATRNSHLKEADSFLEEMHRLQGEHRLLTRMQDEESSKTADASTIVVEPAEEQ